MHVMLPIKIDIKLPISFLNKLPDKYVNSIDRRMSSSWNACTPLYMQAYICNRTRRTNYDLSQIPTSYLSLVVVTCNYVFPPPPFASQNVPLVDSSSQSQRNQSPRKKKTFSFKRKLMSWKVPAVPPLTLVVEAAVVLPLPLTPIASWRLRGYSTASRVESSW